MECIKRVDITLEQIITLLFTFSYYLLIYLNNNYAIKASNSGIVINDNATWVVRIALIS